MHAIIETGGKQYRVAENDVITVERLPIERGDQVEFDRVLGVGEGEEFVAGTPCVAKATVVGRVVRHGRGPKIRGFKYKPKKRYRRQWGHRQNNTEVLIEKIQTDAREKTEKAASEED